MDAFGLCRQFFRESVIFDRFLDLLLVCRSGKRGGVGFDEQRPFFSEVLQETEELWLFSAFFDDLLYESCRQVVALLVSKCPRLIERLLEAGSPTLLSDFRARPFGELVYRFR